jgi:alanine racemase
MDQHMLDVTHIPDVELHDEVVLIGKQGNDEISVYEIGETLKTSPFEFVTCITPRIPRVYVQGGRPVNVQDLFEHGLDE